MYKSAELKEALQETSDSVKVVPIPTIEDEVIMDIIQLREEEEEKEGNHESEIEVVIVEDEPFVLENPVLKTEPLALEINNREVTISLENVVMMIFASCSRCQNLNMEHTH